MELIRNPFIDHQFWSFLIRTFALLGVGLIIMGLTQLKNLGGMVKSLAFKKFLSWIVILPALLLIIHSGRIPILLFIVVMIWASSAETMRMLRIRPFFRGVFITHQVVTVAVMVFFPENIIYLPLYYLLGTFFAAGLRNRVYHVVDQMAFSIIASLWIGFVLALVVTFVERSNASSILTVVFGSVVLSDVFAYLFGGLGKKLGIGKRPLASNISPNKVVAGMFGNIVGVAIAVATYGTGLGLGLALTIIVTILAGLGAAFGDLAESIIKRHAGVKDSSELIPFHGGMMDRIDSLLLVVPLFYLVYNLSWESPFF